MWTVKSGFRTGNTKVYNCRQNITDSRFFTTGRNTTPDADGYTPLMLAIDWSEYDVATAMVQAGADLGVIESVELSMLEYALHDGYATEALLSAMLQRGGLNDAQSNGFDVAQYAEDNDDDTILQLMDRHNLVADSGQ